MARALKTFLALAFAIVAIAAVFTLGFGVVGFLLGFSGPMENAPEEESPYDWHRLSWTDGGRCSYEQPPMFTSHFGVDISDNHSEIDWDAAAEDGVEFAFLRVGYRGTTEGGLYEDSRFVENVAGARAAGISVGAYFYSQATSVDEAVEEADMALRILEVVPIDGPVAFDYEISDGGRLAGIESSTARACAKAFCDRVERAGYEAILYGNRSDLSRLGKDLMKAHRLWFAEYGVPNPSTTWAFSYWQYSSTGEVDGIPGNVDVNIWIEPIR